MIAKRSGPHISGILDGGGLQKYYWAAAVSEFMERACKNCFGKPGLDANYPWGQLVIELWSLWFALIKPTKLHDDEDFSHDPFCNARVYHRRENLLIQLQSKNWNEVARHKQFCYQPKSTQISLFMQSRVSKTVHNSMILVLIWMHNIWMEWLQLLLKNTLLRFFFHFQSTFFYKGVANWVRALS